MSDLRALVEQMRALCDDSLRVPNPTSSVAYAQLLGDANIQIDASHVTALLDALAGAEKARDNWHQKYTVQLQAHEYSERGAQAAEARLSRVLALGRQVVEGTDAVEKSGLCRCALREKCPRCSAEMALDDALDALLAEINKEGV